MSKPDVNTLLDRLSHDVELRRRWEIDPDAVATEYDLTDSQRRSLLDGDVDALMAEGLAERHVQQMRVSW